MHHAEAFAIFAKVGDLGSISGAARALGLPKATVSRAVSRLESAYKVSLVERTTRKVRLTEIGRTFHHRCLRVVEELESAQAELEIHRRSPAGILRVGCSSDVASVLLADAIAAFLKRYPEIDLRLRVGERLLPEPSNLDVVLHSGWLADSRLVVRKLSDVRTLLVASDAYRQMHGFPRSIEDLADHSIIGNFYHDRGAIEEGRLPAHVPLLQIADGAVRHTVPIWKRFSSTSQKIVMELVRQGVAIAPIAAISIRDELRDGRLVEVLPDYPLYNPPSLYALYTDRTALSPKLGAFIGFIIEVLGECRPDKSLG